MDHMETFDPVNPAMGWTVRKSMSLARADKAVAVLHDLLHVVGGESTDAEGNSLPLMDVEVYDSEADYWHNGGSIPSHRFRFVAAAHGASIFVFGGQGALSGEQGASGSTYPVLDTVDEYEESEAKATEASHSTERSPSIVMSIAFLYSWVWFQSRQ